MLAYGNAGIYFDGIRSVQGVLQYTTSNYCLKTFLFPLCCANVKTLQTTFKCLSCSFKKLCNEFHMRNLFPRNSLDCFPPHASPFHQFYCLLTSNDTSQIAVHRRTGPFKLSYLTHFTTSWRSITNTKMVLLISIHLHYNFSLKKCHNKHPGRHIHNCSQTKLPASLYEIVQHHNKGFYKIIQKLK
jgi:hypothetical protein